MADASESYSLITPAKERALWIILAVLAVVALILHLWGWARVGRADWVRALSSLGMLVMAVGNLAVRSRGWLYLVLMVVALGLMVAGIVPFIVNEMK